MIRFRDEEGQVLVVAALSGCVLIGMLGLAVDVGMLFKSQRQAQTAADAAAIAGALEMRYNGTTNVTTVAQNAAMGRNGATDANQVQVSTNGGGYHQGSGFVQVIVKQPKPTIFMHTMSQLMGKNNFGTVDVAGRAVAGITPDPSCIYLLNPTVSGALSAKGAFTVNSAGCGVDINSSNTTSVCVTGNGNNGTFNSPFIRLRTTSLTTQGNCNGTLATPTFTGASKVSDPLGGITGPTSANSWSGCDLTVNATTITAGDSTTTHSSVGTMCFSNFVQISGTVTLNNAKAYVFEKGVEIMTGAKVTSTGTFDIAADPGTQKSNGGASCIGNNTKTGFLQDSQSALNITAPKSGFSTGIAIMEPSGDQTPIEIQFGSNTSSSDGSGLITGLIYAPSAPVYLHDNGGTASATGLISDTLNVCSSTLNITSYNNSPGNASPLNSVQLVE